MNEGVDSGGVEQNVNNGDGTLSSNHRRRKQTAPQRFAFRGVSGVATSSDMRAHVPQPAIITIDDDEECNQLRIPIKKSFTRPKRDNTTVKWYRVREVDEDDQAASGSLTLVAFPSISHPIYWMKSMQ
eukprot:TRINITY_DN15311_c0_g1_i1.p1 TRINITY_DN15311_c0_g1~~TRINITY_DN15311_c0_g1_i1.p1  ORF type:complete len:128 (-),score=13.23 TRINITY_DN15311_c0_g1_i1:21-404(-)